MSIWVVRGGKFGEYENRFLQESKVYLTRDGFKTDLNKIAEQAALRISLDEFYPTLPSSKLSSWSDQIWSFAHEVQQKDWVIVPSKLSPVLHVGEVTGGYVYEKGGVDPYYHSREIKWKFKIPILLSADLFKKVKASVWIRLQRRLGFKN